MKTAKTKCQTISITNIMPIINQCTHRLRTSANVLETRKIVTVVLESSMESTYIFPYSLDHTECSRKNAVKLAMNSPELLD